KEPVGEEITGKEHEAGVLRLEVGSEREILRRHGSPRVETAEKRSARGHRRESGKPLRGTDRELLDDGDYDLDSIDDSDGRVEIENGRVGVDQVAEVARVGQDGPGIRRRNEDDATHVERAPR